MFGIEISFLHAVAIAYGLPVLYAAMLVIRREQMKRLTERTESRHLRDAQAWSIWIEYMRFVQQQQEQQERQEQTQKEVQNA